MENYRKIQILGKGNFGYVLQVQNINDRQFYAMKVIDVSLLDVK